MTPPQIKKLFKKEYSFELIRIAKGDLDSAILLSKCVGGRPENVLYLVQQSIEKSLKSLLVYHQIPFPLVHDLGVLIALLPDKLMPPSGFDLIQLNPYASVRRYEEGVAEITAEEIATAISAGDEVWKWVNKELK
jgi:HEPN domain-containing protein